MAFTFKRKIASKIVQRLSGDLKESDIIPYIKQSFITDNEFSFTFDISKLKTSAEYIAPLKNDIRKIFQDGDITLLMNDTENNRFMFNVDNTQFINHVLLNDYTRYPNDSEMKKKVVVDFSSPNIAKPFHFGHLRSTIIGNFISNINKYMNNDVYKINYLGDWGTQFGMLKIGLNRYKIEENEMIENPINTLYKAYVYANELAKSDESILNEAKDEFRKMEFSTSTSEDMKNWQKYKCYTVNELEGIYKRLGIVFDEYSWESNYSANKISHVMDLMKSVLQEKEGAQVFQLENDSIPILKNDGCSLYITRDIAAAIDRYERIKFDEMYYVVDTAQSKHFINLKKIIEKINLGFHDKLHHIRFGRISGMSTRKGQTVFLHDILDEAKIRMGQKQIRSTTTKSDVGGETTDVLGISAIIINDLRKRRTRDYKFTWDTALEADGATGVKLQYTHCRLVSLLELHKLPPNSQCNPNILQEPEALQLIYEIARFEEVIKDSYDELEACHLVSYLFKLCSAISKAITVLKVKGQQDDVAIQRLLLFNVSRQVLSNGMSIIGIKPLNKM